MIQFNLLPDVKLDYVKTRRTKRIAAMVAGSVAAGSLTILILLFIAVNVVQKARLNSLNNSIKEQTQTLKNTPNLNKILTVQNQLNSLGGLHAQKPQVIRLNGYLQQLTPAAASIAELQIDFSTTTVTLSGSANNLATVNKFVDTFKFTSFKYDTGEGVTTAGQAYKDVVLSTFSVAKDNKASYQITFLYDPVIFDSSKTLTLVVPNTVTTRSATDKPLFDNLTVPLGKQ